jgi:hypothetical protein
MPTFTPSSGSISGGRSVKPAPPSAPRRTVSNRDWIIAIECNEAGLTLYPARKQFPVDSLTRGSATVAALKGEIQRMIERQQARVREGEPAYRPIIRFLVRPDGMKAMLHAYPLLEPLQLPMHQIVMEKNAEIDASIYRP